MARANNPAALVLLLALLTPLAALSADGQGTAVVELYTSQGCSSCPPADALLGRLTDAPDVIALSLHVDYWDRLGWTDPFGSPRYSRRQRDYAASLDGSGRVYTPQMVIDGRRGVVGHRASHVRAAIEAARARGDTVSPEFTGTPPSAVVIPPGAIDGSASVWLARFDERHRTAVERGENAGETLINHHVVRSLERLGSWSGERVRLPVDAAGARGAGRDGVAVWVQGPGAGRILGATQHALGGDS